MGKKKISKRQAFSFIDTQWETDEWEKYLENVTPKERAYYKRKAKEDKDV